MNIEQLAIEWLQRLVQIPSVTPEQAGPRAGEPGEARIAQAIAGWFQQLGGEVIIDEVLPNRPNVYGIWRGTSDQWLALDVHVDTVGVEQMPGDPFSGHVSDGKFYGRGAVDTKASLGVALAVIDQAQREGRTLVPNILLAATVDEETGARGAPAFAAWLRQQDFRVNQLMVAEPTLCQPVHGHKGVVRQHYTIQGVSSHSSQPHLGKNAITAAAYVILAFDAEQRLLSDGPAPSPLGHPSLTVSIVQGGRGLNVVPDECTVSIDRRVVSGETPEQVVRQLDLVVRRSSSLPYTVKNHLLIDAFYQDPNTEWLQNLSAWSGKAPALEPYGTNAWAYGDVSDECVVLGPGSIAQAHGLEEWVAVSELVTLAEIYRKWWQL